MYIVFTKSKNYVKVWHKTTSIFNAVSVKKSVKKANDFIKVEIKKI